MTIAPERHDVVHVQLTPHRGMKRKDEEDEADERRVTSFYGSTGPVQPLMFSNFPCGRARRSKDPVTRTLFHVAYDDCHGGERR